MCFLKNCFRYFVGNGYCDIECNNRICDFDGGDCECVFGCFIILIVDGFCDFVCDMKLCYFDGLDCGGCEVDLYMYICDENVYCVVMNILIFFV